MSSLPEPWALVIIDMQMAGYATKEAAGLSQMPGFGERVEKLAALLVRCRERSVPVIHLQEVHRRSLVDFGRELDGAEGPHFIEGDPFTDLVPELAPLPGEAHIIKRRYSGFFGTDLEIVLRGLKIRTVVLAGELTDVCVHYTFADAHQRDYYARVVEDCCGGSTLARHEAALEAMRYLQTDACWRSEQLLVHLA
jgi:nicotinamidase-related amidase